MGPEQFDPTATGMAPASGGKNWLEELLKGGLMGLAQGGGAGSFSPALMEKMMELMGRGNEPMQPPPVGGGM